MADESTAPTTSMDAADRAFDELGMGADDGIVVEGETPELAEAQAETVETPVEAPTDTPDAVVERAEEAPQVAETALSDAEKFLREQGHQPKKVDGRDVWLPYKTVKNMLERYAGQGVEPLTREKTALAQQIQQFEEERNKLRASVMGPEPEKLLEELAQYNPAFRKFLQPQGQPPPAAPANDPMPEPDLDLGNGRRTYSLDGLKKRDEWVQRQVLAQVDARLTSREKQADTQHQIAQRAQRQLQEAQTWPGFGTYTPNQPTEFQQAVIAEFNKSPTTTLRQAYLEVYARQQDPSKIREQVIKELQAAPKGTSVTRTTTDQPRTSGPVSTTTAAARALARLEKDA